MRKAFIITAECLAVILFLYGWFVPKERKNSYSANEDISAFDTLEEVPWIGNISDDREIVLSFQADGRKLHGVVLYFKCFGNEKSGTVNAALFCDGQPAGKTGFPVKDVFTLLPNPESTSTVVSLKGKELIFSTEALTGECRLVLTGEGIDRGTGISLYANRQMPTDLVYESEYDGQSLSPLYTIEVLRKEYPHRWSTALVLIMALLFGSLLWYGKREK